MSIEKDQKGKNDLTPEEQAKLDTWIAQHKGLEFTKSDKAIIEIAADLIVDAISNKAAKGFLMLYSTYNRNYHFIDVGTVSTTSKIVQKTSNSKKEIKVGDCKVTLSKNQCKFIFKLIGCEIEVTYKKDPNFMEI